MASLKPRRGKWFSRIRWYEPSGKRMERQIALRTDNKTVAYKRNREVSRYEKDIIKGIDFDFSWLKDGGKTEVKELTLIESISDWIERRKKQPDIRNKTIQINENGIAHLFSSIPKKTPLKSITTKHMDKFSDDLIDKGLSETSINIHLRTVKTFFRYIWKRGLIDRIPMIETISLDDTLPIYITDDEFHSILNEVGADSFYGKVFFFYRETGVRLREPFIATLDGNWLDIPNTSKGKRPRSIELDDFLLSIYKELRQWADTCNLVEGSRGRHLSKQFKKALRICGVDESKHMHSLRHTYAVRQRVIGVPLANIQAQMGHRSITTTEIYTLIDLKKLRNHFPTLTTRYTDDEIESQKVSKYVKGDTLLGDTVTDLSQFIEGKVIN
tara:strand:- start:45 stop:1199 length:1155 start_codon:yes stop_codon:yes gene_type:complete